jgi:hypothetical protein
MLKQQNTAGATRCQCFGLGMYAFQNGIVREQKFSEALGMEYF